MFSVALPANSCSVTFSPESDRAGVPPPVSLASSPQPAARRVAAASAARNGWRGIPRT
jgi:hypothetical protein